ncbi:MAG: DNA recombination protein RmuC [Candidatus Pacebacteria bacterium]|jgi:DNA recombination protein RmuC|nr:DNA recombination protein RmuC [bacterium]MDP6528043.1 DNA recombination protein RmuC [Candidatus Paceibacterota bacterium]MDP6659569.1 DNA recombination protein RmuC [Candidatus Paceibacterota bacterium]|tara:strand:+ start:3468 stop:4520 length:1053 start_codon:yes stop_codon:yes gene_type:complete
MSDILIVLVAIAFLVNAVALFALFKRGSKSDGTEGVLMLQKELQELRGTMNQKIGESTKQIHDSVKAQLGSSDKIVRDVTERLARLDETNKQVVSFADQLQHLQDILQNPKQRGVLGEYYLETVLKNVLPPGRFAMQYKFEDGEIVDAVVFLESDKILPVDSKFSLENYNRILESRDKEERKRLEKVFKQDLKNRIDETAKYIRPNENTMEFAFMFIPSEGVYYDLLVNKVGAVQTSARDLIEYAFQQKKVIIVSPTSFMAYLQTVLQGLKSLEIEKQAQEIMKRVGELGRHVNNYEEYYKKLGNSLATTVNHYNTGYKELGKMDKDVLRITGESANLDPLVLDKPDRGE